MGPVDEALGEIELAATIEVLAKSAKDLSERLLLHPLLKATVAGLVWRVLRRQRLPRGACPKDPQERLEHGTRVDAWSALAVFTALNRDQRLDDRPLLVGESHVDV